MKTRYFRMWIVLLLLSVAGQRIHAQQPQDALNSQLIAALATNDTTGALVLVNAGADPNTLCNNCTAFFLACGADWDDADLFMQWAIASRAQAVLVEAMLTHGAKVNAKDRHERTPLIWAVISNRPQTLDLLLKQRASVNLEDEDGYTALYFAVYAAVDDVPSSLHVPYIDLIQRLLAHGANPRQRSKDGITPLQVAQNRHRLDIAALLQKRKK